MFIHDYKKNQSCYCFNCRKT